MKENYKKQTKKSFEMKNQSREKAINYMLNGKAMIIPFNSWIDKKDFAI